VKVTGEPIAPVTRATAVCGPGVGPKVQVVLLTPSPPVVPSEGENVPLLLDQLTLTSRTGLPSRVTTTRSGLGKGALIGPVCTSPLLVEVFSTLGEDWLGPLSPPDPHPKAVTSTAPARNAPMTHLTAMRTPLLVG
jgi:hypothetical protein